MVTLHAFLNIIAGVVNGLIDIPCAGLACEVEDLGVVLDGVADPFLLQRCNGLEELALPILVLRQGVIDDEEAVVVDACHILDDFVDGARTELATAEVRNRAGVAAETAAAAGMEEIDHRHSLVVVEVALVEVAAARPYVLNGRHLSHIVIDLLQFAAQEVLHDLFHAPLALAEEEAIDVLHHVLGMKHRRDAARHDELAAFVVFISNLPAALDLRRKHHRERHDVARLVEVDFLDVLVGERDIDIIRQGSSESHWAVRGKVKGRLPAQLLPLRVDEFHFDCLHILSA